MARNWTESSYSSVECVRAQSRLTLLWPHGLQPTGSSVIGIFQARILEWVAISYSRGSSWPRDWTHFSCISCIDWQADSLSLVPPSVVSQSFQLLSRVQLFVTPWTAACPASLSITNSQSLLKFMSIELVMPSNHLILCRLFLLPPSIFPSIRVFSIESALHIRWPNYWRFSFNISPSNVNSGLIFARIDWLDLAVQGTLKSLLQHHSSKVSILWHSAFFYHQ